MDGRQDPEHEESHRLATAPEGGALPNFFIAGTMRSGTTSLTRYLSEHPKVFIAPKKEIHYFDLNYSKGIGWYKQQFSAVAGKVAIGDATPSYMYMEEAVARMAEAVPGAQIIALLRHPVDRAYSHYWLWRSLGIEKSEFLDAIGDEPRRLALNDPFREYPYLDMSRYVHQLRRLCGYFPREAVHVVLLEELKKDPSGVYRGVCRHLGINEDFVPGNLGQVVNAFVTYRSKRVRRMRHLMPGPVWRVVGRLNTRRATYAPLDTEVRAELEARFAKDNAALASWLGQDLSAWGS